MNVQIEVQKRHQAGKGPARQLRRSGKIPAVFYGNGASTLLSMDPKVARSILLSNSGQTGLLTLRIFEGEQHEERVALLKDYQLDPITSALLHVDFFEVSMDKPIRIKVPVRVVGQTPLGIKEGGVLSQPLRELSIECLPAQIPAQIDVDVSALQVGQGIHVREAPIPPGVKVLDEEDLMVVHVAIKMSESKLESLLKREAAEGAPSAEPAAPDKGKSETASPAGTTGEKDKEGKK
jgi:large subunit ribosomal protein L25